MSLTIQLMGTPRLERDGAPTAPPRGHKAWALLAYLALSRRAPSRRELAELLFAEANDPMGALRWNLSQLRRAIEPEASISGDPVRLELTAGTTLDAAQLLAGSQVGASVAEALSAELLAGLDFPGAPVFESWLLVERRRLGGAAEALLNESALAQLAAGAHADAVRLASRAVALNPLEEGNQELLVRCMATGGDRQGALAQAEACEELFRRELGVDPSPALRRAADFPEPHHRVGTTEAAARGLLDAGRAAISAGATEAGITALREACTDTARIGSPALRAEALCALGTALVHVVRGWDGEGAVALHQSLEFARRAGAEEIAASAHRELGWIGAVSGRREQALTHLALAEELTDDDGEIAAVLGVRGMHASDGAEYPDALELLGASIDRAEAARDRRQQAFSRSMLARAHLLRGELGEAESVADQAIADAQEERWLAYLPFPETTRAEVDRLRGDLEGATQRFDHAFTLGCRLGDPCWEAFAARGIGLVRAANGEPAEAERWLAEAHTRCVRWPDTYAWAEAWVLDATATLAVERGDPRASEIAEGLEQTASRAGLRELAVRAMLHRARLGVAQAARSAELLAREIDNPALSAEVGAALAGNEAPARG